MTDQPETISLVAALDRNRVIGIRGQIPWHLPDDLRWFKRITMGKPILMGRKTFDSIGRPLPGRHNIVLTRNRAFSASGVTIVHTLESALAAAGNVPEVMVIGGSQLFHALLPQADRLYLTYVDASLDGDTFFPKFERAEWRSVFVEDHARDADHAYSFRFVILQRRERTRAARIASDES